MRRSKAGPGQQDALHQQEWQIQIRSHKEHFGRKQFLPLIGPGQPELAVADEWLCMHHAGDKQNPADDHQELEKPRKRTQYLWLLVNAGLVHPQVGTNPGQSGGDCKRQQDLRPEAAGVLAEDIEDLVHASGLLSARMCGARLWARLDFAMARKIDLSVIGSVEISRPVGKIAAISRRLASPWYSLAMKWTTQSAVSGCSHAGGRLGGSGPGAASVTVTSRKRSASTDISSENSIRPPSR